MFFQMSRGRDPLRVVREFVQRVEDGRVRPLTAEDRRRAVELMLRGGGPPPRLPLSTTQPDTRRRIERMIGANRPDEGPQAVPGDPPPAPAPASGAGLNDFGYVPVAEDVEQLAGLIYSEAESTPEDFVAVGWTAVNRVGRPGYGRTLRGVIHQPGQFEPVREGNRRGRDSPHWTRFGRPDLLDPAERASADQARRTARDLLTGRIPDPTGGATHFHAPATDSPWFEESVRWGRLEPLPYRSGPDGHLFYRERRNPDRR
ncbi:MAG: cell wall hydrolase [Allosphingosinicella sp.]